MDSINDLPKYQFEGIRLTYEHFMEVGGKMIPLEEPIFIQSYFDRTFSVSPYVLNEVCERMKEELYKRVLKERRVDESDI